jgi:hypothetical protein
LKYCATSSRPRRRFVPEHGALINPGEEIPCPVTDEGVRSARGAIAPPELVEARQPPLVEVNDRGSKHAYRTWGVSAHRHVGKRTKHGMRASRSGVAQSHGLGRATLGQEWAYSLDELATQTGGSA